MVGVRWVTRINLTCENSMHTSVRCSAQKIRNFIVCIRLIHFNPKSTSGSCPLMQRIPRRPNRVHFLWFCRCCCVCVFSVQFELLLIGECFLRASTRIDKSQALSGWGTQILYSHSFRVAIVQALSICLKEGIIAFIHPKWQTSQQNNETSRKRQNSV